MKVKAEEFLYKLQQHKEIPGLPRVLAAYGEELYYRSQIAAAVPGYIFADTAPEDRAITIFEKNTKVKEVAAAINTYPFFSGHSLIIIKDEKLFKSRSDDDNKKQELNELAEVLSDVPDYCTVFISAPAFDKRLKFYKTLDKLALLCECEGIYANKLAPWLDEQAEHYGARFDREALGTIMEYLAPVDKAPLQLLRQEIEKLALYAGERKTWTKEDVENIFSALPEASNFAILNFLVARKIKETLEIIAAERKKGTKILPLCALIAFKLRQMLQFMELKRQGHTTKEIIAEKKMNPYAAANLERQCRNFTEASLQQALLELAQLNMDLRKGGRDYARLEEIILRLIG